MRAKTNLQRQAVELRHKGYSYSEITQTVPVSKSSLSLWLRKIKLKEQQRQRLVNKTIANRLLGSQALKSRRVERTKSILASARAEIKRLTKWDLFLAGIILYWAEGTKQKEHNPSQGVVFSNSDPKIIKVFLKWIRTCLKIPLEKLVLEIYIHETYQKGRESLTGHWAQITGIPQAKFDRIVYKKNKTVSYRKNRGKNYYGVLRIRIRKSTDLNRRISGWIDGISIQCGMV